MDVPIISAGCNYSRAYNRDIHKRAARALFVWLRETTCMAYTDLIANFDLICSDIIETIAIYRTMQ